MIEWWETLFPTTHRCHFCTTPVQVNPFASVWNQLCFACKQQLQRIDEPVCKVCGKALKQTKTNICSDCKQVHPTEWVYNRSVFEYTAFVKQIIWRYKYKGQEQLAKPLGWLMAEALEEHWGKKRFVLTYVPLHVHRLQERGFNQAEQLAMEIGRYLRLPVVDLLERTRMTHRQSEKRRSERLSSLMGAFSLKPNVDCHQLASHSVLLVDDIYTTGATLRECCKPFKEKGIEHVYSMTIAR